MSDKIIHPIKSLHGTVEVPGDKSISHRALILSGIAEGVAHVTGLLDSEDVGRTRAIMEQLGVGIEVEGDALMIHGVGLHGLRASRQPLYCGNSGTTLRLMSGLLAGQAFSSSLTGDASLDQRPMGRVIDPLKQMGAQVEEIKRQGPSATGQGGNRIIQVKGSALHGMRYQSPVASAQVKSALLLAGLYADGAVAIEEPYPSRDHTERLLAYLGADVKWQPGHAVLQPQSRLTARPIAVPRDFSSAAFFLVAGAITPNSSVRLEAVLMNPTRNGLLDLLTVMGAAIKVENAREVGGEPIADLVVESSPLKGVECGPELIPSLVDEVPILAVAACMAEGETHIRGAQELRLKETDRLHALATELSRLGAVIEERPDGLIITGPTSFSGGSVKTYGDHRMAMALSVAAGVAAGPVSFDDYDCVAVSYPGFLQDWLRLAS